MAFAIMRCTKLNTVGNLAASLQHCYRERPTANANADRTPENEHRKAKSVSEAQERVKELLPEKYRKDAVLAVEYLFTASPEWWPTASKEQQQGFFDRSLEWVESKYGKESIVTATIHQDETTPHLSVFVVPLTKDGKLSAKHFIGGRNKMSADQTSFAACVSDLGLVRGIEGSQATHQRVKRHYGLINRVAAPGTAYKTIFGNIKPEAWDEAQNALAAFQVREKAIKQRESKLKNIEGRFRELSEKAKNESEARIEIGYANDVLRSKNASLEKRLDELQTKFKAVDDARMKYIDESRYYQSLLKDKGLDYEF